MTKATCKTVLIVALGLFITGCSTVKNQINRLTGAQQEKEREIATLRVEYDGKIAAKAAEISSNKDGVIAAKDGQMRAAANGLYGASQTFSTIMVPTRTDLVIHNFVAESWTALGNQLPDQPTLLKINERIKTELDATKTSLADLQKSHAAAIAENTKLVDATKAWQDRLAASEKARVDLEVSYRTQLDTKQQGIIALQQGIVALEKARADDAAAIQAIKTKASMVLGGLSLLCAIGVIYSPVGKTGLVVLGTVTTGAAVHIWVVKVWMVLIAAGVVAMGLVIYALVAHRKEEKLGDALVLSMSDIKTDSSDVWAKVAPVIDERLKKYVRVNGQIKTAEDPSMKALINQKLVSFDQK
jgi:hypothetical protein